MTDFAFTRICPDCGSYMHTSHVYAWRDSELGSFELPVVKADYQYCTCGFEYLSHSLLGRIVAAEAERLTRRPDK